MDSTLGRIEKLEQAESNADVRLSNVEFTIREVGAYNRDALNAMRQEIRDFKSDMFKFLGVAFTLMTLVLGAVSTVVGLLT